LSSSYHLGKPSVIAICIWRHERYIQILVIFFQTYVPFEVKRVSRRTE
jgi:hypothetical protein